MTVAVAANAWRGGGCTESGTPQGEPRWALGGGSQWPLPPPPKLLLPPDCTSARQLRRGRTSPDCRGGSELEEPVSQLRATERPGELERKTTPGQGTRAALRGAGTYLVEGQREWVTLVRGWRERTEPEKLVSATFPIFRPVCTSIRGIQSAFPFC